MLFIASSSWASLQSVDWRMWLCSPLLFLSILLQYTHSTGGTTTAMGIGAGTGARTGTMGSSSVRNVRCSRRAWLNSRIMSSDTWSAWADWLVPSLSSTWNTCVIVLFLRRLDEIETICGGTIMSSSGNISLGTAFSRLNSCASDVCRWNGSGNLFVGAKVIFKIWSYWCSFRPCRIPGQLPTWEIDDKSFGLSISNCLTISIVGSNCQSGKWWKT